MSAPKEEERFMANVLDLSDLVHELTSICWDEGFKDVNPTLIVLAKAYLSNYDKVELIETFITYSNEYWDEIKKRNENFFIEHSGKIFAHLPVGKGNISAFKMLFTTKDKDGNPVINNNDRDAVWDMFDSLVKICIKYIHRVRECVVARNEETGKMRPMYKNNKFPDIKVREHAKKWDIVLDIPQV
jgi:hypothetical protein